MVIEEVGELCISELLLSMNEATQSEWRFNSRQSVKLEPIIDPISVEQPWMKLLSKRRRCLCSQTMIPAQSQP